MSDGSTGRIRRGFFLIAIVMFLVVLAVPLFCVIDAANRPSDQFLRADSNKTLWIVLPLVFGVFAAIVYLAAIRPKFKLLAL